MDLQPKTVLVVDDVPLVKTLVSEYLRECGFEVLEAATGEEAVSTLEAGLRVDIVFSDIELGGPLDGYALARWVHDQRPGVRTVLGTGGEMGRKAVDICYEGAIIRKPYNLQYVVKRLHNALADRPSSAPEA